MPCQALRVTMPIGIYQRSREGVISRHGAVGIHPQDLARQRVQVLRQGRTSRVTGGGIEHPVGAKSQPPAVVVARPGDTVHKHHLTGESSLPQRIPSDPVGQPPSLLKGIHQVEVLVRGKLRVQRQPQQAALTRSRHSKLRNRLGVELSVADYPQAPRPLGEIECARVVEGKRPGHAEVRGHDLCGVGHIFGHWQGRCSRRYCCDHNRRRGLRRCGKRCRNHRLGGRRGGAGFGQG